MVDVLLSREKRFEGWAALRAACEKIGPSRILFAIVTKASHELLQSSMRFVGDPIHTALAHGLLARALVVLIADESRSRPLSFEEPAPLRPSEVVVVKDLLTQLNELVYQPTEKYVTRASRAGSRKSRLTMSEIACFGSVVTGRRNRLPLYEVARAWLQLRKYWSEEKTKASRRETLARDKVLETAFDSIENAFLLAMVLTRFGGVLRAPGPEVDPIFTKLRLGPVADLYAPDAATVVGTWQELSLYPASGVANRFLDAPMVTLSGRFIVSPDPSVLHSGMEYYLLRRVLLNHLSESEKAQRAAQDLLGDVFERYICRLLEYAAEQARGERYVEEFTYGRGLRSPDGFLISEDILIVEAKATRFSPQLLNEPSVDNLIPYLDTIAGANRERNRRPLEQGARFLAQWEGGDAEIVSALGDSSTFGRRLYLVVCPEDLPFIVHWPSFLREVWGKRFNEEQRTILEATEFLSVVDLEVACCALAHLRQENRPTTLAQLISDWRARWRVQAYSEQLVMEHQRFRLKGSLTDFVRERYPRSSDHVPHFIDEAWAECQAAVRACVTAGDSS